MNLHHALFPMVIHCSEADIGLEVGISVACKLLGTLYLTLFLAFTFV